LCSWFGQRVASQGLLRGDETPGALAARERVPGPGHAGASWQSGYQLQAAGPLKSSLG